MPGSESDFNMLLRAPTTLGKLPPDAPSNPPDDGKGKPQQPSQALGVAVVSYGYGAEPGAQFCPSGECPGRFRQRSSGNQGEES
jgi:hypothetical protein